MSSIEGTFGKSRTNQTGTKASLDGSLDNSIAKACDHKISSGALRCEIVETKHLCSKDTFYTHLNKLCSGDEPRIARRPPPGIRSGEVWYVVAERKDELGFYPEESTQVPRKLVPDHLANRAIARAIEIIDHIDKCTVRLRPEKVLVICNEEIAPFVVDACHLRRTGYPIPLPWEYKPFYDDPLGLHGGSVPVKKNECTILLRKTSTAILHPHPLNRPKNQRLVIVKSRSDRDAFIRPTIYAWQDWLRDVVDTIEKGPSRTETGGNLTDKAEPGVQMLIAGTRKELRWLVAMAKKRPIQWDDWASKHKLSYRD